MEDKYFITFTGHNQYRFVSDFEKASVHIMFDITNDFRHAKEFNSILLAKEFLISVLGNENLDSYCGDFKVKFLHENDFIIKDIIE